MADQLKPCPFCGSEAEEVSLYFEGTVNNSCDWFVRCHVCFVESGRTESDVTAIAAWNTRANTPESSAAQGAIDDVVKRGIEQMRNGLMLSSTEKKAIVDYFDAQPSDATAQPRVDLTDERAAFEAWWISQPHRCKPEQFNDGMYKSPAAYAAWNVWQARALLANTAQGKPDHIGGANVMIEDAPSDTDRLNLLTAYGETWSVHWRKDGDKPVKYRMANDGDWEGKWHSTARQAIDAALAAKKG